MFKLLKNTFLLAILLIGTIQLSAQKFGYVNSAGLLEEMAEIKQANSNLETLQKQLQSKGQNMLKDFQLKYTDLEKKVERGELSPQEQKTAEATLQEQQQAILDYEKEIKKQLAKKQETLYKPILDKVNTAIENVAKENGYTYIFDTSPGIGVILYSDTTADITTKVKAKLAGS